MKKRPGLQKFSKKNLKVSSKLKPIEVIEFLEAFKELASPQKYRGNSKLISIKMPQPLLNAFKAKSENLGRPYQAIIKELMWKWLRDAEKKA